MLKKIRPVFKPEMYHGIGKTKSYFEGWYYKIISADEQHLFAIIPGIAMDKTGNKQSFIQILEGKRHTAKYIKFDFDAFLSNTNEFEVKIADNYFESNTITLNLSEIKGTLTFLNATPWPGSLISPGIMGPFTFVPFMECYHGILSMDHEINGKLEINGEQIDFTGGRGYIEKDWGSSFPEAYIWMQTNHFSKPGISLKISVAKIPWIRTSFVGFIAGLYFNNQLIKFTTYNHSHLIKSYADKTDVEIILENKKYRLEIKAQRSEATELASPILGFMDGRISESMNSTVTVKLLNPKTGTIIFEDYGRNTALEVAGNLPEILIGY